MFEDSKKTLWHNDRLKQTKTKFCLTSFCTNSQLPFLWKIVWQQQKECKPFVKKVKTLI